MWVGHATVNAGLLRVRIARKTLDIYASVLEKRFLFQTHFVFKLFRGNDILNVLSDCNSSELFIKWYI